MYAAGIPERVTDFETHHEVIFDFNSVLVLFYYYPTRRRVYIVCNPRRIHYMNVMTLPGVSDPVSVLCRLSGRNVDRLKNALFYLEKISNLRIYNQSINFWTRLILVILAKKNTQKHLETVYRQSKGMEVCLQ